ncbi:hypothetical protein ACS0TY_016088 [Phlomoides rotata]
MSLPEKIRYMTNLRHIFLEGCWQLRHMPSGIKELTSLKTLSLFIMGDKRSNQLDELEHLCLGGRLQMKHLERAQNNKNANLVNKPNLIDLEFYWDAYYSTSVDLTKMMNDEKTLILRNLKALEYIVEKYDNGCQNLFPSLENLKLFLLPNLKGLVKEQVGEMLPNLQILRIVGCPLLILTSTSVSSSTLKNLKEVSCGPLNLPSISSMFENLSSLVLQFSEIDDSTATIPEDALQGLPSLEKLAVVDAKKHRLPEKWSRDLNSLTELFLFRCNIRICLSEGWLWHLTSLEKLHICSSVELVDFGEEFKHLHFLKDPSLKNRPT